MLAPLSRDWDVFIKTLLDDQPSAKPLALFFEEAYYAGAAACLNRVERLRYSGSLPEESEGMDALRSEIEQYAGVPASEPRR
jgi:hypothetical protein